MEIFVAWRKPISIEENVKLFFEHVWVHFCLPKCIILKWDNWFHSIFLSSLWAITDTKLKKFTTFHSQIDGQIEVVN